MRRQLPKLCLTLALAIVCGTSMSIAHAQNLPPWGPTQEATPSLTPQVRASLPDQLWSDAERKRARTDEPVRLDSFERIADQTSNAIVNIEVTLPENPYFPGLESTGQGSGFIIHRDGYVLTNAHVVATATHINVTTSDRQVFPAQVVGLDPETDIALLRIDTAQRNQKASSFQVLQLADSDDVRPGRWVIAIGNPYGLNHTVTAGIVSAVGRRTMGSQLSLRYTNFIQFDAAINLGNSGGPLLDMRGDVIGMNTALQRGNDLGFAIPSNMIKEVLAQMITGDMTRSWSGMAFADLTATDARKMPNGRHGARIVGVLKNSPAGRAGLKDGDVVLSYNGHTLEDADELRWLIAMSPRKTPQTLEIYRGGRQIRIDLALEEEPKRKTAPTDAQTQPKQAPEGPQALGVVVGSAPLNQETSADQADAKETYVQWVDPQSPAAMAGLKVGDKITHLNDQPVDGPDAFVKLANKLKKGDAVNLRARRESQRIFIFFQHR